VQKWLWCDQKFWICKNASKVTSKRPLEFDSISPVKQEMALHALFGGWSAMDALFLRRSRGTADLAPTLNPSNAMVREPARRRGAGETSDGAGVRRFHRGQ
jgi:hypothetical protein